MSQPGLIDTGIVLGGSAAPPAPQPGGGAMGPYDPMIAEAAQQYNLDPVMLRRQFVKESAGDPNAVSNKGATGIAQLMGPTAGDLGVTDPTDPRQSIFGGAKYMRQLLTKYNEDYTPALAAYNWGMGHLDTQGIDNAPDETVDYVNKIRGGQYLTRKGARMASAVPAPANDQYGGYPSGDNAYGGYVNGGDQQAPAPPAQPALIDTGIVLGPGQAQPPALIDTGIVLGPKSPLNPVPQLPDLPPQWSQDQTAPPTDMGAVGMPPLGQPPVDLAKVVPNDLADPNRVADPATPWKPEAGWGEVAAGVAQRAVPNIQKVGGGLLRSLGENQLGSGIAGPGVGMTGEQLQQNAQAADAMTKSAGTPGTWANTGQHISDEAEKAIIAHTPNVPQGSAKYYAGAVGDSIVQMIPGLLGTAAMGGNPAPMIADAGISRFGSTYADETRKNPNDPHGAAVKAAGLATIDAAATALSIKAFGLEAFKGVSGTVTHDVTGHVANFTRQSIANTIKNLTVQIGAVQPAIGLVNHGLDNVINGRPVTEGMGEAYITSAITNTLVSGLAHVASGKAGLTKIGPFEKPEGVAYPFNPEGLRGQGGRPGQFGFQGEDIGTFYAGGRPQPQKTLRLPSPAATQAAQPPQAKGAEDGTVSQTGNAQGPQTSPVTGEAPGTTIGGGRKPLPPWQPAPAPGGDGTAGVSGSGVPAEGAETTGHVPAAEQQPKAAFVPPTTGIDVDQETVPAAAAAGQAAGTKKAGEVLTSTGESVPVNYEVVDASQLAHPEAGDPRQPRNRETSAASAAQIGKIAGNLDPRHLMESDVADRGAPIVNAAGTVLAGNGRFAAIKAAAENHPEKYQAYVDAIKAAGHEIPPDAKTPVLVRRTGQMTPEAEVKLARDSNVSRAMSMGAVEQAHVDASHITDEMMSRYAPGDPRSERAWLATLPETERAAVINEDGTGLSQAGKQRLKGAMLAKAYGHPDLLKRALENPSDDTKGITNSLADVAPEWAKMKVRIAADEIPAEFDITKNLTQALDMVRQQRESNGKITPSDMVDQLDLERGKLDPVTEQLYRSFYNDGMTRLNSAKGLTGILDGYLKAAHNYTPQEALPGFEKAAPNPAEIIKDLRSGEQDTLFDKEAEGETGQETALADEDYEPLAPEDQHLLKTATDMLANAQKKPKGKEAQIARLTATRDKLLAKRRPRRKQPVDLSAPKPDNAPKTFEEHKIQEGAPTYRTGFVQIGLRKGLSQEEAEDFADSAINKPPAQQVEMLRKELQDHFKFKNVTVQSRGGVQDYDARNTLLDLHRAAHDMMFSLGYPLEAASLGGRASLHIAPPARGQFGSYHPGTRTITVNGRANVFGHEWGHAWDHDMIDMMLKSQNTRFLATQAGTRGKLDPRDPLAKRVGYLLNLLFHDQAALAAKKIELQIKAQEVNAAGSPTPAAKSAQKALDLLETGAQGKHTKDLALSKYRTQSMQYSNPKYYGSDAELFARAMETYLARVMEENNVDPRGVVMPDEAYLSQSSARLRMTFPKESERLAIHEAIQHVIDGYRDEVLHGSVAAARAAEGGNSDPSVWGKLNVGNKPLQPFRQLVQRLKNWRQTLNEAKLTDPNLPDPGDHDLFNRWKMLAIEELWTRMGVLEAMHHDGNDAQKAALQEIMDRLGHTPGSGRHNPWDAIEERAHNITNQAMRDFSAALDGEGFDPKKMTKQDKDHLRHAMTTGDTTYPTDPLDPHSATVPIDPKIERVARKLRQISDRMFDMLRKAGIPVGYAKSGHFMRLYSAARAYSDEAGFIKAAKVMYSRMFDEEVGKIGDDPAALLDKWKQMNAKERGEELKPGTGGNQYNNLIATRDGMDELARNLKNQKKIEARIEAQGGVATPAQKAELDKLQDAAQYLAQAHHEDVRDIIAEINANDFHKNLTTNYSNDFGKGTPGGRFLNARELPPYADQIMREYMDTDPLQVLPHYYESAARKISYAERFGGGDNGHGKREELIQALKDAKLHPEKIDLVNHIIDTVSGGTSPSQARSAIALANSLHTSAAVALMGRSSFTMAAEPFVGALHTGEMQVGIRNLIGAMGQFLRTANAKERAELADYLGVTRSALHEDILLNRANARYSDSPNVAKWLAKYYNMILVPQLTRGNKRGSIAGHDWYLKKLARDTLDLSNRDKAADRRDEAYRAFNEFGIPPEYHFAFSQWLAGVNGLPQPHDPANAEWMSTYARAMRRLGGRTVIETSKMEKQLAADDKWRGLIYQFTNYNNGMTRNVLEVMASRVKRTYGRNFEREQARGRSKFYSHAKASWKTGWKLGATGATVGGLIIAGLPQTIFREYMFNHNNWKKHEEAGDLVEWITELTAARSGVSGMAGLPMEVLSNLRYEAEVLGLTSGAAIKTASKNLSDVVSMMFNNQGDTSNSNARYYAGVRGIYNLLGVPLEAFIATTLSEFGMIAHGLAAAGYMYFSSPQFADTVATKVAGEKGTVVKPPKLDEDGEPIEEDEDKEDDEDEDEDTAGTTTNKKEGISASQGAGLWVGFLDDLIAPAWQVVRPGLMAIPNKYKIGAALGVLGYGANALWDATEKFRNAPPPKPKKEKDPEEVQ